jgi:ketosteroid isomerase-like protein
VFEHYINAGDLASAVELYELSARVTPPASETPVEIDGIREMLTRLIGRRAQFKSTVARTVAAGDVAVLYTDWEISMNGASEDGAPPHKAIEVLRRQTDGTWKLIVGDPEGRE